MPGKDALGDRMKVFYEDAYRIKLPRRIPVILRADGKAFHTYTRGLERPYSQSFMDAMDKVALEMCKQIQGAHLAYVQSDEISVLIRNDMTPKTGAWMENNLQKIVSVGASIAGTTMTVHSPSVFGKIKPATFDGRAILLPEGEVTNYFLWRQQDATRNALSMLAQAHFSQKRLHGANQSAMQEMLFTEKGINFDKQPIGFKRGRCVVRVERPFVTERGTGVRRPWEIDQAVPMFGRHRDYVEKHLARYELTKIDVSETEGLDE